MKIGLVYGFWGQNIGNAFFNLGAEHLLKGAGHEVFPVQDHPAYWTFRDESKGSYENRYRFLEQLEIDLLVLQGPLFTRNFGNIWLDTLKELDRNGVNWAVLSGAFRSYSAEELAVVREVSEHVAPLFVSTRDSESFEMLSGSGMGELTQLRDGICSAFFLPQSYTPPKLRDPLVALCFDHFLEPSLVPDTSGSISLGQKRYRMDFPERFNQLASKTKGHAYIAQLADRREVPTEIDGLQVVRPEHRTNPHLPFKIYQRPNALASDEPYTYLTAYANAEVTLSDRVHACVATLAYGGSAHLWNPTTRRKALFDTAGAGGVVDGTVRADLDLLAERYDETIEFLGKTASAVRT